MTNWAEKSDFELSCAVMKKRFGDELKGEFMPHKRGATTCVMSDSVHEFDINNWADMGPVIADTGIDMDWPDPYLGNVGTACKYLPGTTDITVDFAHKSEGLRAAAICYLEAS